jgi:hypothetical protein
MKNVLCSVLGLVTCLALLAAAPKEKVSRPQYDHKGQLIRPAGYGMNYSPGHDRHRPQSEHERRWDDRV